MSYEQTMDTTQSQEVLLRLIEDHSQMARHSEDQRATMTNFLVTIASVLLAFVVQQQFAPATRLISLLLIVLGVFGLLASLKYAQHFHMHYTAIKRFQERLHETTPEIGLMEIQAQAVNHNLKRYRFMRQHISIVGLWLFLNISVCATGVICIVLSFL